MFKKAYEFPPSPFPFLTEEEIQAAAERLIGQAA